MLYCSLNLMPHSSLARSRALFTDRSNLSYFPKSGSYNFFFLSVHHSQSEQYIRLVLVVLPDTDFA